MNIYEFSQVVMDIATGKSRHTFFDSDGVKQTQDFEESNLMDMCQHFSLQGWRIAAINVNKHNDAMYIYMQREYNG